MNAAINVNVSVAVTASHAIAASAPMVISRTMSPPHVPFGRPGQNIPKSRLDPVTHVTGRDGFARAEKPHGIEARRLRAAPDLNCGHNSAQFPPLSSPLRRAVVAEESPQRLSRVAGRGLETVPRVMGHSG
jgi:hypothetical protein